MKISELKHIIKEELLKEEEGKQVQNITKLKQVLNLDQKQGEALRKAAVQGLKPNPTTNAILGGILLKMLTMEDNTEILKVFNAIKMLKTKK